MKKLLILFVALAFMVVSVKADAQVAPTSIDFGNCDAAEGWGVPAIPGGVYGGVPYNQFCLVWEPGCTAETSSAYVQLEFAGGNEVISIRHLDGQSNLDSFEVFVDGLSAGTYKDSLNPSEDWVTTDFTVPPSVGLGVHTISISVSDPAWSGCNDWGQLAIDSISIEQGSDVPEFGVIAGAIALVGALGIFLFRRK